MAHVIRGDSLTCRSSEGNSRRVFGSYRAPISFLLHRPVHPLVRREVPAQRASTTEAPGALGASVEVFQQGPPPRRLASGDGSVAVDSLHLRIRVESGYARHPSTGKSSCTLIM